MFVQRKCWRFSYGANLVCFGEETLLYLFLSLGVTCSVILHVYNIFVHFLLSSIDCLLVLFDLLLSFLILLIHKWFLRGSIPFWVGLSISNFICGHCASPFFVSLYLVPVIKCHSQYPHFSCLSPLQLLHREMWIDSSFPSCLTELSYILTLHRLRCF